LCGLGAKVVITGRNETKVKEVAQKCLDLTESNNVLEVVADMSKDEDVRRLLSQTIERFGKLDVLVNNAGIAKLTNAFDPNIMQVFDETIHINVRQLLLLTTLAIPYLIETKGNIVNISSDAGLKPVYSFAFVMI
jgi:NAD(P)-dependent dehydrogenase (short-subunit alcohol dehydrogenase family)